MGVEAEVPEEEVGPEPANPVGELRLAARKFYYFWNRTESPTNLSFDFAREFSGLLRAPISGVMVAGEVIMDNGVIVSLDEKEVAERARECAKRVWKRLG